MTREELFSNYRSGPGQSGTVMVALYCQRRGALIPWRAGGRSGMAWTPTGQRRAAHGWARSRGHTVVTGANQGPIRALPDNAVSWRRAGKMWAKHMLTKQPTLHKVRAIHLEKKKEEKKHSAKKSSSEGRL